MTDEAVSDADIVRAGFIPLLDAAPLIVAYELGFARDNGVQLRLSRETSWATIRDRLAVSHLDVAHALAPLPIAANLGLGPLPLTLVVPMAFGYGGNTVTVSASLWAELAASGAPANFDGRGTSAAIGQVVRAIRARTGRRVRFGIVHQFSAHHYELAYWLAAAGAIPGRDVELVVLPPSLMAGALQNAQIDGFCAGEPWGSVAATIGAGVIATTKAHIWRASPEKVLAAREQWAEQKPQRMDALVRALHAAAAWCEESSNRKELAAILARPHYLDLDASVLMPGLSRTLLAPSGRSETVGGFLQFSGGAATFPWTSHALWFLAQMARWGEVEPTEAAVNIARTTYRPDIYRRALGPIGAVLPTASAKVEGALTEPQLVGASGGALVLGPDGFFDGRIFDPDDFHGYVARLKATDA